MTHAGRVMDRPDWVAAAQVAIDFLHQNLWRDGRLLASYKQGEARLNAYLDDYAFLLDVLLESMQAGYREADMAWARELADALLTHFEDTEHGGFFSSGGLGRTQIKDALNKSFDRLPSTSSGRTASD